MRPEDQVTLSFFRELSSVKERITLVQHIDTHKIYMKKQLSVYDRELFIALQEMAVPGIPRIHHVIATGSDLIVIEEYLNYPTLSDILSEVGTLPSDQALDIALQLCRILEPLHRLDPPIIHRDLKPSNILLSPEGKVYLIDFNAAKFYDSEKTRDTILMGTADFAAPEQFGFRQSDTRTDIYGIGVLLNVMLTGCLPNDRMYDGGLTKIIARCTAMEPAKRYNSIWQLKELLELAQRRIGAPEYGKVIFSNNGHGKTYSISYGDGLSLHDFHHAQAAARAANAKRGWKSWLPPGFRTMTPWKMILAVIGYASILWVGLSQSVDVETTAHVWFNRMCALISLLIPVFFLGNYRGIADRFPISRSYLLAVRILGSLLWSALITFALLLLCILLDLL